MTVFILITLSTCIGFACGILFAFALHSHRTNIIRKKNDDAMRSIWAEIQRQQPISDFRADA